MSTYPSMQANGYDVGDAVTIHVSNSTSEQNKQKRNSILGISIVSYALLILALDILIILNQSVCEPKGDVKNITEPAEENKVSFPQTIRQLQHVLQIFDTKRPRIKENFMLQRSSTQEQVKGC